MLKEALQHLQSLSENAARAQIVEVKGVPRTRWIDVAGELTPVELPPEDRRYEFFSIASLCEFLKGAAVRPILFYCQDALFAYLDSETRCEEALLRLNATREYGALLEASAGRQYEQAEFIRLLRVDLGIAAPELLGVLRNVKWRRNAEGSSELQHGRESLGRSVDAEVTGTSEIPEELTFEVQMVEQLKHQVTIEAAIEILVESQTFRLTPLAGQRRRVFDETMAALDEELRQWCTFSDIFCGRPDSEV